MEAVERNPSAPRFRLSFDERSPAGQGQPRSRPSPSRRLSKHQDSSLDNVLLDEFDMLLDAAATVIQAAWRGYQARQELRAQHHAAATIQAHYRGYWTRQELAELHRAATTIQAHYRGYCTRQALAHPRAAPSPTSSLRDVFTKTYRGLVDYVTGAQEAPSRIRLVSRRHPHAGAQSPLGRPARRPGECRAGREKPRSLAQRGGTVPPGLKKCPQCGRSTMVRVLVGVGRGTGYQSDTGSEDHHHPRPAAPGPPSAGREGTGYSAAAEEACYSRAGAYHTESAERAVYKGHRPWTGTPPASKRVPEDWASPTVWHQGREKGERGRPHVARAATWCGEQGRGRIANLGARRYPAAASFPPSSEHQQAPGGTAAAWLSSKDERRVFKTRKKYWQLVRAATRIQAFWRGCQARRALREQKEAAVRIQAAFRGYRTRTYLSALGVLSGGEMEEEADSAWSYWPV